MRSAPRQLYPPRRFFLVSTTTMVASAIAMVARKIVMGHLLRLMILLAASNVVRVEPDQASVQTRGEPRSSEGVAAV